MKRQHIFDALCTVNPANYIWRVSDNCVERATAICEAAAAQQTYTVHRQRLFSPIFVLNTKNGRRYGVGFPRIFENNNYKIYSFCFTVR